MTAGPLTSTVDWLAATWRDSKWPGRLVVATLALGLFGSGLWLLILAAGMWQNRDSSTRKWPIAAVAAAGVVWIVLVAGSIGSQDPGQVTASGVAPTVTSEPNENPVDSGTTTTPIAETTTTTSATTSSTTTPTSGTSLSSTSTVGASSTTTTSTTAHTAGGTLALDVLLTIPVTLETPGGYNRDLFPHWEDADGDGCDTREEVLIRDAAGTAQVDPIGCTVVAGDWISPYDGRSISDPTQLEIDHVVSLKEAWDSGAASWDSDRRRSFANDLTDPWTLVAVSSESNQAKGAADPSNWMPPDRNDWCRYLRVWVAIKSRWQLSMDESEFGRIRNLLTGECEGTLLPVRADAQTPPSTMPPPTTTLPAVDSPIRIRTIVYDAPGNDVVYNDSEYVALVNDGDVDVDVAGWSITDLADHTITIPDGYLLPAGGELRIYTGPGDSTASRYFAGLSQAIWNNSGGDRATLRDRSGTPVDTYTYTS